MDVSSIKFAGKNVPKKGIDFEAGIYTSSSPIGRFICREPARTKSSVYAELDATTCAADGHITDVCSERAST